MFSSCFCLSQCCQTLWTVWTWTHWSLCCGFCGFFPSGCSLCSQSLTIFRLLTKLSLFTNGFEYWELTQHIWTTEEGGVFSPGVLFVVCEVLCGFRDIIGISFRFRSEEQNINRKQHRGKVCSLILKQTAYSMSRLVWKHYDEITFRVELENMLHYLFLSSLKHLSECVLQQSWANSGSQSAQHSIKH